MEVAEAWEAKYMEMTDMDTGAVKYITHLANGDTIESHTPPQARYDEEARRQLKLRLSRAVCADGYTLELSPKGNKSGLYKDEQILNIINTATDTEWYKMCGIFTPFNYDKADPDVLRLTDAEEVISTLISQYFQESKEHFKFGDKGGNWCCGASSGVWIDFSLAIKAKGWISFLALRNGCYYLAFRITLNDECEMKRQWRAMGGTTKEVFDVSNVSISYQPFTDGKTTVLSPCYGKPFVSKKELKYVKRVEEIQRQAREEEKRLAHEAFLADQRRREREWRAKLEADLASTIVAYNAEEENLKKVIRFNREKVAAPLAKRIEAKEAEREREEAERRHAEKLKQKEAERLAKFAPKQRK